MFTSVYFSLHLSPRHLPKPTVSAFVLLSCLQTLLLVFRDASGVGQRRGFTCAEPNSSVAPIPPLLPYLTRLQLLCVQLWKPGVPAQGLGTAEPVLWWQKGTWAYVEPPPLPGSALGSSSHQRKILRKIRP